MSLIGHLSELRTRLIICLVALGLAFVVSMIFADRVLQVLVEPVKGLPTEPTRQELLTFIVGPDGTLRLPSSTPPQRIERIAHKSWQVMWPADSTSGSTTRTLTLGDKQTQNIYYHNPVDPFLMQMRVALMLSVVISLPVLLWQLWLFISPGLTDKERRLVKPLLCGALILFPIGAAFAYFLIKLILIVMMSYTVEGIDPLLSIYEYLSLLTTMMLVFGLIFEFPLVIAIAARVGLVQPAMLTAYRRHAYVGMAFGAMILTPNDGFTMLSAFVPLILLYEISIGLARPMAARHARDAARAEDESTDPWGEEGNP